MTCYEEDQGIMREVEVILQSVGEDDGDEVGLEIVRDLNRKLLTYLEGRMKRKTLLWHLARIRNRAIRFDYER